MQAALAQGRDAAMSQTVANGTPPNASPRHRTQEAAGSSPASSILRRPCSPRPPRSTLRAGESRSAQKPQGRGTGPSRRRRGARPAGAGRPGDRVGHARRPASAAGLRDVLGALRRDGDGLVRGREGDGRHGQRDRGARRAQDPGGRGRTGGSFAQLRHAHRHPAHRRDPVRPRGRRVGPAPVAALRHGHPLRAALPRHPHPSPAEDLGRLRLGRLQHGALARGRPLRAPEGFGPAQRGRLRAVHRLQLDGGLRRVPLRRPAGLGERLQPGRVRGGQLPAQQRRGPPRDRPQPRRRADVGAAHGRLRALLGQGRRHVLPLHPVPPALAAAPVRQPAGRAVRLRQGRLLQPGSRPRQLPRHALERLRLGVHVPGGRMRAHPAARRGRPA